MGKYRMTVIIQPSKKVTYGEPREAKLDWKIRQVTKDIFKDPLDVIGQNIENIIDEYLIRDKTPVVCNVYCNSEELIIEDFIGMTPEDIENNYIVFGVSGKSKVFGRYGHGGKDTALAIAGYFHVLSRIGKSMCAYKIWEDKNLKVQYSPAWGLDYGKQTDGTLIIIPNLRERFTLEEIEEYLRKNFYMGLIEEEIIIGLGKKYGGRKDILRVALPSNCEKKIVNIKFKKEAIEKYCKKPPLKHSPEVKGFYLLPKENEIRDSGYNIYAHGKFITAIPSSIKGVGHLAIDFLIETTELTGSKELKLGKTSFYTKHLLPQLEEWEKKNLAKLKEAEIDREFLEEIESLLGPLWGGKKRETGKKAKPRQTKRPIEFQENLPPQNSGKTPGHGRLILIEDNGQPLVMGIQLPDSIFINKGNPDGEYIWQLDRKTKKTLLYSRAAIFLPFIKKSKSGSLTSTDLTRIHEEALKSQEFWINAIRRDHGDKKTVRYIDNKRLVIG
jgi:hypothetical protein